MSACQPHMKDLEVIHSYLNSQASRCFQLLYQRYAGKIYAKCLTLLQNEVWAEDATQEIFTKIFLNLARFREKSKFSTWVYSITYNYCIDYLRRKKKRKAVSFDSLERIPDVVEDEIPDKELLEMDIHELKVVLQKISVKDSAILLMKYQDEMSIKDISEVLNKTESAVKMQIKRAKERARKIRREEFLQKY